MDFFKNKVKKYQEKKLDEILFKIQFHQSTKNTLEEKMNKIKNLDDALAKDILYHGKMVDIWIANEKKLREQMNNIE
ncbi:hypothetical protein OAQ30_02880 [Nitrosopumilus sp.]|nr:hypothetical protein [Nitrosopumilus sp.]|tara:strand:+ start:764 stop:994 length:231 start_codon:yes stop_codon:yes gene_type:complete